MSTRCQLRFTENGSDRVAQVYRHSDGYPESVLPTLEHLQELLQVSGAQRDASYTAAQFIFIDKLWSLERSFDSVDGIYSELPETVSEVLDIEAWEEIATTPSYLLGHAVENPTEGIHGDEEYLYEAKLPDRNPMEEPVEWSIKVSEHRGFPRWDGPTEQAFEMADWQFQGSLAEAISEMALES